jgi:hypothetical protein
MEEIVRQLPTLQLGAGKKADDPLRWRVKTLFYLFHARGYGLNGGVDDTVFGDPLYDALKEFQKAAKLIVDGVCGGRRGRRFSESPDGLIAKANRFRTEYGNSSKRLHEWPKKSFPGCL